MKKHSDASKTKGDHAPLRPENDHDTPPPIMFENGSLKIEIDKTEFDQKEPPGKPTKCRRFPKPDSNKVEMGHIRITNGGGKQLYFNKSAEGSKIKMRLTEGTIINAFVEGEGKYFEINTTATDKFFTNVNRKPSSSKRFSTHRIEKNTGGDIDAEIESVEISQGDGPPKSVPLLEDERDEARVSIWLHDKR